MNTQAAQKVIDKHTEKAKSDAEIIVKSIIEKMGDPSTVDLSNKEVSISNTRIGENTFVLGILAEIYNVYYVVFLNKNNIKFGPKKLTKEEKKIELLEQINELKINMDYLQNELNDLNDDEFDDSNSD